MNNTYLRLPNTPSPSHLYGCHFYFIQMSVRALSFSSRVPRRGGKWKRLCCIYTAEMFKIYVGRINAGKHQRCSSPGPWLRRCSDIAVSQPPLRILYYLADPNIRARTSVSQTALKASWRGSRFPRWTFPEGRIRPLEFWRQPSKVWVCWVGMKPFMHLEFHIFPRLKG